MAEAGDIPIPGGGAWAYSIRDAAKLMGLSFDTLERMVARGSIPVVQERPGAKRTILHADIVAYLASHRVPAKQKEGKR